MQVDTLLVFIIASSIIYLTLFVFLSRMQKNNHIERKSEKGIHLPNPRIVNFESDSQFLMFTIKQACNVATITKLYPLHESNAKANLINDETFQTILADATRQVVGQLSTEYRETLSYYTADVIGFVTQLVYNELITVTIELNRQSIKKMN